MNIQLTNEQKAYFAELAAQLVTTHGEKAVELLNSSPAAAITEAHDARRQFIVELLEQRTDRARMAVKIMGATVYAQAVAIGVAETAIEHCAHIADYTWRRSIGLA